MHCSRRRTRAVPSLSRAPFGLFSCSPQAEPNQTTRCQAPQCPQSRCAVGGPRQLQALPHLLPRGARQSTQGRCDTLAPQPRLVSVEGAPREVQTHNSNAPPTWVTRVMLHRARLTCRPAPCPWPCLNPRAPRSSWSRSQNFAVQKQILDHTTHGLAGAASLRVSDGHRRVRFQSCALVAVTQSSRWAGEQGAQHDKRLCQPTSELWCPKSAQQWNV
jgi:hypothetical protein